MSYTRAELVKVDEKTHRVMLGSHEIGTSKTDFDARFHINAINDALEAAYEQGKTDLTENLSRVVDRVVKRAPLTILDPKLKCKSCGKHTTYTRATTHGLCMKCETEKK